MAKINYESNGNHITKLREEYGLTQSQFGEILGISEQMVYNYENDKNTMPIDKALILSKALNCSLDWIYDVGEQKSVKQKFVNYTEEECMKFIVDIRDFITCSDGKIHLTIKNKYWNYIREINKINNSARAKCEKRKVIAQLNGKYREPQDESHVWRFSVDEKEFLSKLEMPMCDSVPYVTDQNVERIEPTKKEIEAVEKFIELISDTSYMNLE